MTSLSRPPPPLDTSQALTDSMTKSMTIEEMRHLHERAVRDAASKSTELRLVLASRYRELVGSSDEVIKMNDRAEELHELVKNLPDLVDKLLYTFQSPASDEEKTEASPEHALDVRRKMMQLPREIYRSLSLGDVYKVRILYNRENNSYSLATTRLRRS